MKRYLEDGTPTVSKLTQGVALPACSQDAFEWNLEWGTEDPDWFSSALRKIRLRQVMAVCLHILVNLLRGVSGK